MVEEMLLGSMVGLIMYLLFMAHDVYQVRYASVRTEFSIERSRHEE
jgi:hypothetical protein